MLNTVDLTSEIGKVRNIIDDLNEDPSLAILSDERIQAFLDEYATQPTAPGKIKLAAASALRTIASHQSLLLKKVVLLKSNLETDGPAVARDLRQHARELRSEVLGGDNSPGAVRRRRSRVVPVQADW